MKYFREFETESENEKMKMKKMKVRSAWQIYFILFFVSFFDLIKLSSQFYPFVVIFSLLLPSVEAFVTSFEKQTLYTVYVNALLQRRQPHPCLIDPVGPSFSSLG